MKYLFILILSVSFVNNSIAGSISLTKKIEQYKVQKQTDIKQALSLLSECSKNLRPKKSLTENEKQMLEEGVKLYKRVMLIDYNYYTFEVIYDLYRSNRDQFRVLIEKLYTKEERKQFYSNLNTYKDSILDGNG